jgi:hypothetical protein
MVTKVFPDARPELFDEIDFTAEIAIHRACPNSGWVQKHLKSRFAAAVY